MTYEFLKYGLAVGVGVVAGIINTLAGSGSSLTLPMLVFLGLPSEIANGTNRVGIFLQNIVGMVTLRQAGKLPLDANTLRLLIPAVVGGGAGAWLAADLSTERMDWAIAAAMVTVLALLFVQPSKWLSTASEPSLAWWIYPLTFLAGFYGGFVQAGVGVVLLAVLILGAGYDAVTANGLKLVLTFAFTLVALPVFAATGKVDWAMGGLMAAGQGVGAYLAARYATRSTHATRWIRVLLIVVIVATLAKMSVRLLPGLLGAELLQ